MKVTRRMFLRTTAATGATLAAGATIAAGCGNDVQPAPLVDAQVIDDPTSPRYGQIEVVVAALPVDLMPVGGAVTLRLSPLPPAQRPFDVPTGGILLVHRGAPGDAPEYIAVDSPCKHAGCPLGYSAKDRLIECPCHGSRYRAAPDAQDPTSEPGQVLSAPARADLTAWAVDVDDVLETVYVDLNRPLGSKLPPVVGGKVTLSLAALPMLSIPGGFVTGKPDGLADTLLVARIDATTIACVSAVCTHLGCLVAYSATRMDIECPCHGSTFAVDGTVTTAPATTPLKKYPVSFDGQTIIITVQ